MNLWHRFQDVFTRALGADADVVRKVEQLDQRQRQFGHQLRNLQAKINPLCELVERMREEDVERPHH